MDLQKTEYQFTWILENYSYVDPLLGRWFESPAITYDGLESTSWVIGLCPFELRRKGCGSLYLQRSSDDSGPETFLVNLNISIITTNGSTLYSEDCEHTFKKSEECTFNAFVDMDELYVRKNTQFLPKDTVIVRCKLWKGEGRAQKVTECTARTRIGIGKITFLHKVENFSTLKIGEEKTLQMPNQSEPGTFFSNSIYLSNAPNYDESINVNISSSCGDYYFRNEKVSLLDRSKNTVECYELDYRFDSWGEDYNKILGTFTRQFILKNRDKYLLNDELNLLCEYTFTFEDIKIEEFLFEIPLRTYMDKYGNALSKNGAKESEQPVCAIESEDKKLNSSYKEKLTTYRSVIDDLKELYTDRLLTDVQLKTATKSFPAHKNVLCARCSVFRSMLSHDMKERNEDCIQVDDLEDETVHQLLLFLYSDSLEDLRWESALKLYYAADKYDVKKLKVLCSIVLVDNLSPSNSGEFLLLAETHSDRELKKLVQCFILAHENEVFGSDEWFKLNKTNPELVMSTMQLKYKRNKGGK